MDRLKDKTVLVTGAARGQGEAEARAAAAEGARVILTDVLDDQGRAVAEDIGDAARYLSLDVTSGAAWTAALDTIGELDGLVNNAGILTFAPIAELSEAEYRRVIDINQVGVFLGMKAAAPRMRRGGSIVNISSIDGLTGMPGLAAYCSAKFAVRGMTKVAALEFAPLGLRVNSIHPGVVRTPMIDRPDVEAFMDGMIQSAVPLGRAAEAEEVASMAVFLLSNESAYCTGAEFVVDGGMTAGIPVPLGRSA